MIFDLLKRDHPKSRFLYAVTGGTYLGELLVYIESTESSYGFLSLPEMKIRDIPQDKFNFGLENKIIDIVKKLPKNVFNVCKKQYIKNKAVFNNATV